MRGLDHFVTSDTCGLPLTLRISHLHGLPLLGEKQKRKLHPAPWTGVGNQLTTIAKANLSTSGFHQVDDAFTELWHASLGLRLRSICYDGYSYTLESHTFLLTCRVHGLHKNSSVSVDIRFLEC